MNDLFKHNTNREPPTFANINMLGACNASCYFCLGKDIPELLSGRQDHIAHYENWLNFLTFLDRCDSYGIEKLYLTGQNTDALMYKHLGDLLHYIQEVRGFKLGLRTNGILAHRHMNLINQAKLETGYSIHSLTNATNNKIMGSRLPDWDSLLQFTERSRVAVVVNRYNIHEFFDIIKFLSGYRQIQHIQARRISTETRRDELLQDVELYERLHDFVKATCPLVREFYGAPIYLIHGVEVTFWRTIKSTIGSLNYFTDGTISDDYFVIKGYTEANGKPLQVVY